MTDTSSKPAGLIFTFPIVNGYIQHPLFNKKDMHCKFFFAYKHLKDSKGKRVRGAFLESAEGGRLLDVSDLEPDTEIVLSTLQLDGNVAKSEQHLNCKILTVNDQYLTLAPIAKRKGPHIAVLDAANHPYVLQLLERLNGMENKAPSAMMRKEISLAALYPLRALALSTTDCLAERVVLAFLGEKKDEARAELEESCWAEDLVPGQEVANLRKALV